MHSTRARFPLCCSIQRRHRVRKSISVSIVLLSVLTLGRPVRTAEPSKPGTDAQRFTGAWRVLSVTDTRPDGTVVPDLYRGRIRLGS
jgi:hypothetical protein